MRLEFNEKESTAEPDADMRRIIQEVFDLTMAELDLTSDTRAVNLAIFYPEDVPELFADGKRPDQIPAGMTITIEQDPFVVGIVVQPLPCNMMFTLVHELIHVQQIAQGRLSVDKRGSEDERKWGLVYEGERFTRSQLKQLAMQSKEAAPYEAEAYARTPELHLKVLSQLPHDSVLFLKGFCPCVDRAREHFGSDQSGRLN